MSYRRHLPILLLIALVLPAGAGAETADEPTFAEQQVWFDCAGGDLAKVQNGDEPIGWSEEAPDRSVQEGAGCGFADVGALYNDIPSSGGPQAEPFDPVFEGTVEGNLTNLTAELHVLGHGNETLLYGEMGLFVWLAVDDETLYFGPDNVVVPAEASETGASQRLRFTLSGLDQLLPTEPGDGTQERTVTLSVAPWWTDEVIGWVWGTTEVPAGITFNDPEPAAVDIRVRPGDGR